MVNSNPPTAQRASDVNDASIAERWSTQTFRLCFWFCVS